MELIKGENVLHSFKENFLEYTYLKKSYNTDCFEVYCKQCNSLQPAILVADLFTRKYLSCNRVPRGPLVRNVSYLGAINPIQAGVDFVLDIRKNKEDFKKIVEYVLDEKTKILGHVPDGYDKENENIRDIVSLIAFNRFPNIPPRKIISTLQYRSGKDMIRIIKSTDSQWQKIILESNKIKSTKFTKKVLAESDDFYTVLKIMKFFKKPDNVKKMLVAPGAYLRDILDFDIFMADHIERFGETLFCNKFLSEDWTHITFDTAMMYEDLKEQMGNKKLVIPSGSIRELHNKYMVERGRIREKNIVFSLPKRAIKMNDEDSVFEISAAEDSNTLTRIGDDLRICVGSYKHKVNSGTSYIYELKRNKEAVACIETSGNLKKVIQAKSKFNDQIVGDDLDFVLGWIRKNKLKIDTADLEENNE